MTLSKLMFISTILGLGLSSVNASAAQQQCMYMGGTANVKYISADEGIAAMTGSFDGGAYAKVTSTPKDVGNGRSEFTMQHYFIHKDGSTIFLSDKSFIQKAQSGEITAGGTDYTIIKTTGRFSGFTGTFSSRGGWLMAKGVGTLLFEGRICKAQSD